MRFTYGEHPLITSTKRLDETQQSDIINTDLNSSRITYRSYVTQLFNPHHNIHPLAAGEDFNSEIPDVDRGSVRKRWKDIVQSVHMVLLEGIDLEVLGFSEDQKFWGERWGAATSGAQFGAVTMPWGQPPAHDLDQGLHRRYITETKQVGNNILREVEKDHRSGS
ncbi:hypothetical protein C8R44DRAFT_738817 [Mycena epipterygia]|nr:hypothetical protein C8R44DRAFT_738817 [Mycena epipterygia]